MKRFNELIWQRLNQRGLKRAVEASVIIDLVNSISDEWKAKKIHNKVLYCQIESIGAKRKAMQQTNTILNEIKNKVGDKVITKIIWRLKRDNS